MIYPILAVVLFFIMFLYFRIADHYNIIDHPNERSSHTDITIRGGGVIFVLAAVIMGIIHPSYWMPALGILLVGGISFLDDVLTLSSRLRLLFQLISVSIMFLYIGIFHMEPFYICILLYIMVIGVINMYNFMDGINGITGLYSLVILCGLQYVNLEQVPFVQADMIWLPIIACVVFLFFNFRKKAKCFAGDVGSVSIAFWVIMLIMQLIYKTHNWSYILFLLVYGIDSVLTIAHRLVLKQNIMKAHRLHFYQVMANERKVQHLYVSTLYALIQGGIILIIITNPGLSTSVLFMITIVPLVILYLVIKPLMMKAT